MIRPVPQKPVSLSGGMSHWPKPAWQHQGWPDSPYIHRICRRCGEPIAQWNGTWYSTDTADQNCPVGKDT